jgi:hypothetical protein
MIRLFVVPDVPMFDCGGSVYGGQDLVGCRRGCLRHPSWSAW